MKEGSGKANTMMNLYNTIEEKMKNLGFEKKIKHLIPMTLGFYIKKTNKSNEKILDELKNIHQEIEEKILKEDTFLTTEQRPYTTYIINDTTDDEIKEFIKKLEDNEKIREILNK
jgi:hypothetical protein